MNAQERDQLNQLLKQLVEVRLAAKDPEAESLIREAATQQPDATYLLVQRTLLLDQALINAKTRIDDLQNQLQRSKTAQSNSFLSNDPWAQPAAAGSGPVPGVGSYQIPRNAQQPQQQQQQQQQATVAASPFGGGGSSFLGNVATTAAGVVAGSFLFQGIENLMGGGHHASGFGQQALNDHNVPDQTVINNYYGDDAKQLADNNDSHDSYADNSDSNDFFASNDDDSFVDDDTDDSSWA